MKMQLQVLCGSCTCVAETVANPKANDDVTCPRCNRRDRFDKVMKVVGEHVAYQASILISDSLAKSNRGNPFVKLSVKKPPNRTFRWIASEIRI